MGAIDFDDAGAGRLCPPCLPPSNRGELAALLELPRPDPASDDTRDNAYVFERRVHFRHGDGTESVGYIDLYKRGAFVLEAKKLRQTAVKGFDEALLRAWCQCSSRCTTNWAWPCSTRTAGTTWRR